jgi:hypothetical protein
MSDETEAITAGMGRAAQGLSEAQRQLAAASAKADEIAAQAHAQYGMHAVARQLKDVSEVLQVGHGLLGNSAQTLGRSAAKVGQVHAGMSPGLVIKHLTEASGLIDAARTEMFSGLDQLDRAITQTYAALDGAQPGPLVGMVESAKQSVRDPALREANTAQDAINAVIAGGGQLGNG